MLTLVSCGACTLSRPTKPDRNAFVTGLDEFHSSNPAYKLVRLTWRQPDGRPCTPRSAIDKRNITRIRARPTNTSVRLVLLRLSSLPTIAPTSCSTGIASKSSETARYRGTAAHCASPRSWRLFRSSGLSYGGSLNGCGITCMAQSDLHLVINGR